MAFLIGKINSETDLIFRDESHMRDTVMLQSIDAVLLSGKFTGYNVTATDPTGTLQKNQDKMKSYYVDKAYDRNEPIKFIEDSFKIINKNCLGVFTG
jgi:hypothetical protein